MNMPTVSSLAPEDGMYYSWDAGCIHFIALNSESSLDTPEISPAQVEWLTADLEAYTARKSAGAALRMVDPAVCSYDAPSFAVVYMHRPLYCSVGGKEGSQRCTKEGTYLQGLIESVLQQYGVDLVFAGHVHAYERMVSSTPSVAPSRGNSIK
jgi:hypothetical protein